MSSLNSPDALQFKNAWMQIKDWANTFASLPKQIGIGQSLLPKELDDMIGEVVKKIDVAKSTVSVMLLLHAMKRSLKPTEKRDDVVKVARAHIHELGCEIDAVDEMIAEGR